MMAGQVGAPPPPPNGGSLSLSGPVQPLALSAPMPLGSPAPPSAPLAASDAAAVTVKPGHHAGEVNDVVALLQRCKLNQYSEKLVEEEGYDDLDTLKTLKDEEFDDLSSELRDKTKKLKKLRRRLRSAKAEVRKEPPHPSIKPIKTPI